MIIPLIHLHQLSHIMIMPALPHTTDGVHGMCCTITGASLVSMPKYTGYLMSVTQLGAQLHNPQTFQQLQPMWLRFHQLSRWFKIRNSSVYAVFTKHMNNTTSMNMINDNPNMKVLPMKKLPNVKKNFNHFLQYVNTYYILTYHLYSKLCIP